MEKSNAKLFESMNGYKEMMTYLTDVPEHERDATLSELIDFLSSVAV